MSEQAPIKRVRFLVSGRVQGVGFRPAVFRHAAELGLVGFVANTASGVIAEAEGPAPAVEEFGRRLSACAPPQARVSSVTALAVPCAGERAFWVAPSRASSEPAAGLPPDIATCADCRKELFSAGDRRFEYPFTNCTNCGPRFTIVYSLPYDRERTSMAGFRMCAACQREYDDPADRRFEAQPNACPACGPRLVLKDADGRTVETASPAEAAARLLASGAVLAVKGLGGFHLCCRADEPRAVLRLRAAKRRPHKALAVMFRSLDEVRLHCVVSEGEAAELQSCAAPIVVLRRREPPAAATAVCREVAPDSDELGAFLPYTPLHLLLLAEASPLVMTSGNLSDEPIAADDLELKPLLGTAADYALTHDRPIVRRCDDSVLRVLVAPPESAVGRRLFLRRSRGFVPEPLKLPAAAPAVLACGADLKNVFCVATRGMAFPSQHIGDLSDHRVFEFYKVAIADFLALLAVKPHAVAHDMHPDYRSTRYAVEFGAPVKMPVQHHHAHIAAVMLEHGLEGRVLGVALDGTGYGPDGTIWGGEFLLCDYAHFERIGYFSRYRMPGAEAAVRQPERMAFSVLLSELPDEAEELAARLLPKLSVPERDTLRRIVARAVNSPLASSAGRMFDAAAALLGLGGEVTYEARAAVRLQALAEKAGVAAPYGFELRDSGGCLELSLGPAFRSIVADAVAGKPRELIAAAFHAAAAAAVAEACCAIRRIEKIETVVLGGGVFQNALLLQMALAELEKRNFTVYFPSALPPNDGGIAAGQAAVASALLAAG